MGFKASLTICEFVYLQTFCNSSFETNEIGKIT